MDIIFLLNIFFQMLNKNFKKNTIGIIGGRGALGAYFAKLFRNGDVKVLISDLNTKLSNEELIKKSDIVIFSVPLHLATEIIAKNIKFLRKDQLVMDFTSLKSLQIKEMLKSKAQVIGMHPMFGPSILSPKNQIVLYSPARTILEKKFVKFIKSFGFIVEKIDPQKHDKLMSIVQVLIHFKAIVLGKALENLKIDIKDTLKVASPAYQMELAMVGRIFAQDPNLYGAIEIMNPESKKVLNILEESFNLYKDIILEKDLKKFCKEFEKTSDFMGGYCKKALDKTSKLFKYL
ncbi:MAG: hypothetical protein UR28_C0010G0050 [Candidatus Peregrinibacteria bacterium GW2011_GWF2_33_10]|nr:MAG: hypothetical protein UR28_C0010G0050 [Candidatus Peregrinibacteria bacterium GW2011_GWF2_33_10]OGJ46193.1 MAG: hypothetical protein A2263_04880 [Candidatus Peregrinibacteria bacterium RIFOXYA2_FULL_33_21]OGJ51609.1 MAG: hypothetical protein A2307_04050 [Candidatus Peregrinibacteria bacterium RIFOXYB2_FULL_33_20]